MSLHLFIYVKAHTNIYIYIYREREREREREIYNYYLSKGIVTEYVPWACRVQEIIKSKLLC